MPEPNSFDPFCTVTDLTEQIRDGTVTLSAVVETYLDRINEQDDDINAYTTVIEEEARDTGKDLEKETDPGPLHGVPIALKDLGFAKQGVPMTSGLKLLADMSYIPDKTAATVERLEEAGAIVLGMTNTPELGHKLVTDNEYIGATATPFDTDY